MRGACDEVHEGLRDHIEENAKELGLSFKWQHGGVFTVYVTEGLLATEILRACL